MPHNSFTAFDKKMMQRALELARQGKNSTSPNPRVGCVITRDELTVGEGFHLQAGQPHAEINALNEAKEQAKEATAYVTLEPCSHTGRTPPCAKALIEAGVKRVIIAMEDPNPLVHGKGINLLKKAGIEILSGLLADEARVLNRGFLSRIERGRPFVRLKCAASIDGKTALENGESKWITSEAARAEVQQMRAESCAVLTGIETVLHDNPALNVRIPTLRQPKRIILDTILRTPFDAGIFGSDPDNVWIATCEKRPDKLRPYLERGIRIIKCNMLQKKVDLFDLLPKLARADIGELMIEAGSRVNGAFLYHNFVDEIILFQAPKILGHSAKGLFMLPESLESIEDASQWAFQDIQKIGPDLKLTLTPLY